MKNLFVLFVVVGAIAVACENSILNVKTGPGTTYPCGVGGVVCTDKTGNPNGFCCLPDNTCGGGGYDVGCPADMCCFTGGGEMYGASRPTPQIQMHP